MKGKNKMNEEEEEAPTLKLTMVKGPLSGQVLDFKPRSIIKIGRVVRGNTLAIKDSGISSKHLTIQFDSSLCQWTVTDLDSSNGTVLNTDPLKPSTPYSLSDGDFIKIGELTAMKVRFEVQVAEKVKEEDIRPKRNTRRRAEAEATGGGQLGAIDENSELSVGVVEENKVKGGGRRGRVSKNEIKKNGDRGKESDNLGGNEVKEDNKVVRTRRTRSLKTTEDMEDIEEMQNVPLRRTRSSKKAQGLENVEVMENVVVGKLNLRKMRGKKEGKVVEDGEETENVGVVEEEQGRRINLRSSTKEENVRGGEVRNLDVLEGRRMRKGTRGKRNLQMEESEAVENGETRDDEAIVEKLNLGEERNLEADEEIVEKLNSGEEGNVKADGEEDVNLGRECGDGLASTSGSADVNLEKMTLGDWFDYLEEYLPKQIIDQTEDMILGMRQKAEKFHEFMMLHKKAAQENDEVPIN